MNGNTTMAIIFTGFIVLGTVTFYSIIQSETVEKVEKEHTKQLQIQYKLDSLKHIK
jgi:hypothetical protein